MNCRGSGTCAALGNTPSCHALSRGMPCPNDFSIDDGLHHGDLPSGARPHDERKMPMRCLREPYWLEMGTPGPTWWSTRSTISSRRENRSRTFLIELAPAPLEKCSFRQRRCGVDC